MVIDSTGMATQAFINLPVKDLQKSISFFANIGFSFDQQLTDKDAACMILNGNPFFVTLLKEDHFKTFTKRSICDTAVFAEVLITLHFDSKESIQNSIEKARKLGAIIHADPEDVGWMYQHSFADLDGHQWEFIYIDESQIPN